MSIKNRKSKLPGLPPGSPIFTGKYTSREIEIRIIDFSPDNFTELKVTSSEECIPPPKGVIRWIHVGGVHKSEMIEQIGANFNIHPLVVEDLVNTRQRPKVEIYGDGVFIVARAIHLDDGPDLISSEQIAFLVGVNYVLSFQESTNPNFEPVVERIRAERTRIRSQSSDYLTYALLDLIVDNYFIVLEVLGEKIEDLEDDIIASPRTITLEKLYALKRAILYSRRHIWPLREVVSRFNRDEIGLIHENTLVFLRDLYDHVIRATDIVETYRDSLTSMMDIYLSSISNRMNEVMKLLTVISTIFIPLTLIASIYGMNFYIPETQWVYGYPIVLILMFCITIILAVYFKKTGWLS